MTTDLNAAAAPDESALRGLLKGTLPAADEAAVIAHLEREPAWQAALERVAADDATWQAAAQSLARPPLAGDARLRSALAGVAALDRSHSSINTPTSGETLDSSAGEPVSASDLRFLSPASDPGFLGQIGPYLVEEVIGRGGFGLVLKARDPDLARVVAIKVLSPNLAASANACERFKREARAAAAVTHEHVITIYAVESAPLPHLVMQFVAGQSLQEKLDREGPLGVKETLRIGMQTAAGLAAAHKQGLVHRDVKPANILLENGIERVKLTDFGLARAADDASLTRSGTIAGTPQFMSPEQARGESVDARSDLFSLGAVLYAMLTGRSPFRADSTLAVLKRVCDDPPRPIREVNPDVPDWLAVLITRLLAKNPDDRPASAQQVADQLGHYLMQLQQPGAAVKAWHAELPAVQGSAASQSPSMSGPGTATIPDSVRRRIDRIAYVHLFVLPLSAIGFVIAAIVFYNTWRYDHDMAFASFVLMWVLGLSLPLPLVTGLLALRRAPYWVLMAGTVLTLLSAGIFNLAFLPVTMGLMIWVLVELQRDDVRAALATVKKTTRPLAPPAETHGNSTPEKHAMQAILPVLAKPGKPDPFAGAPAQPRRSRLASVLLGLGLLLGGLTMLGCMGSVAAYFFHASGSVGAGVPTGRLTVKVPDRRLEATLRLRKADYSTYNSGVAIETYNDQIHVVPDNAYLLRTGEYELTVQSDDVTVFSTPIRINADRGASAPQTYEVKPGGVLSIETQPGDTLMSVELNGHQVIQTANIPSQRMVVVPEGTIRLKSFFGQHVYAENWFELKAGETLRLRVTDRAIEQVPNN